MLKKQQMSSFKDFSRFYNPKDFVPTLEAMQKMNTFYHNNYNDMLKLGSTLANLTNHCLHKSTDTKLYSFTKADEDLLEKITNMFLVFLLSFSQAKQLLRKLFVGSLQIYANQMLRLTLVNYTPIWRVNPCPPVFSRNGISTMRQVHSHLDKTRS